MFGLSLPAALATSKVIMFGLIAALLLGIAAYVKGRSDGKTAIRLDIQTAITKAVEKDRASADRRAAERVRDALAQAKVEQAYETAIASAPVGANSPAARALACERLRRAYPGADLPAGC